MAGRMKSRSHVLSVWNQVWNLQLRGAVNKGGVETSKHTLEGLMFGFIVGGSWRSYFFGFWGGLYLLRPHSTPVPVGIAILGLQPGAHGSGCR